MPCLTAAPLPEQQNGIKTKVIFTICFWKNHPDRRDKWADTVADLEIRGGSQNLCRGLRHPRTWISSVGKGYCPPGGVFRESSSGALC